MMLFPGRRGIQGRRRRRVATTAAGVTVVAFAGRAWPQTAVQAPADAPYGYVVGAPIEADKLESLATLPEQGITVRQARVMSADGKLWAKFKVAQGQHGRIAFDWQPKVDAPF